MASTLGFPKKNRLSPSATGMGFGLIIGVLFGVMFKNIALGVAFGVVFGAVVSGSARRKASNAPNRSA